MHVLNKSRLLKSRKLRIYDSNLNIKISYFLIFLAYSCHLHLIVGDKIIMTQRQTKKLVLQHPYKTYGIVRKMENLEQSHKALKVDIII